MVDISESPDPSPAPTQTPVSKTPAPETPSEPGFKTPEQVAAEAFADDSAATGPVTLPPKKRFSLKNLSKKQKIILIVILILLIGGGAGAWFMLHKSKAQPVTSTTEQQTTPESSTVPSKLSGLPVTPDVNKRPVTAIMIENSPDARPQSGLRQASVVFEAIAEGGITRFLTLFQDTQPDYIGPVRSVRPYFVSWLLPFDASVAHVGGSSQALAQLKTLHVRDLDQFANPGAYHRITSRFAPHNVYTSIAKLNELEKQKGFSTSTFTGFLRKESSKSSKPTATSIDFVISGPLYSPHYSYDAKTNTYLRSEGGKPHVDAKTGKQLAPKVVIALVFQQGIKNGYTTYSTIGSGRMYVFQDGIVRIGTWKKTSKQAQFTFTTASGKPLALNPGQTWLSAVGSAAAVSYKP